MPFHRVSLLALLALVACDEHAPHPDPAPAALLEPGRYDLLVRDVVAMACDADPGVMRGQVVPAELEVEAGGGVSLALGVWVLHGAMEPGNLHVEGLMGGVEPEPVDDEDGDVPVEVEDEGEAGGDGGDDSGDDGADEPPDREPRGSALLDARIRDAQLAEGSLFLSMPGCEIELAVVLGRGGRPSDEPTRPPREEEPGEGGSEGGSGGDDGVEPPREG